MALHMFEPVQELSTDLSYRSLLGDLKELAAENHYSTVEMVFDGGLTTVEADALRVAGIDVPALVVIE